MTDKKKLFVRGTFKEKVFDNGGIIIKCAVNLDDLYQHADEKGVVRFDVKRKRECGEDGKSHYGEIDTWKPDPSRRSAPAQSDDDGKLPF
tara:strand:- start:3268 stop:3537 length:270 start_codon:yes stop_codon:yes gene_type:complete